MKCVSLENIKDYSDDITEQMFKNYKAKEDEYRRMWVDQKINFWVQFVISLRQHFINTSMKYDEKCEKEFITFLKVLTQKTYNDLNTYIVIASKTIEERDNKIIEIEASCDPVRNVTTSEQENYSKLRVLNLKLKCAGTFIKLLKVWKSAKDGDDFSFTPPESWNIPVPLAEPLEAYIRAKWGGYTNVEEILGCKKDDLGWWTAPARKMDQSKLQSTEASTSTASDSQSSSRSKKKSKSRKYRRVEEVVTIPPPRTQYVAVCWMPNSTFWSIEDIGDYREEEFRQTMKESPISKLRTLLQYSILPFINSKFHTVNSKALASIKNKKSLGVAPWFIMCSKSFGNLYMNYIYECHQKLRQFMKPLDSRGIDAWKTDRDNDEKVLENIHDKLGAPDMESDIIENISEFLLEPSILIQLPWQPVLFRQWLAAAHMKIMEFELQSMEFRHWPLPKDLEPIVREMIALVTDAKERILLGWTVMSYAVSLFPKDDSKHRSFILDSVILPTLNTLEFLCSDQPYKILQSLKKLAWPSNFGFVSQNLDKKVNLHRSVYTINGNLARFNMTFYGNFIYWFKIALDIVDPEPFPTTFHEDDSGLYEQLDLIENVKQVLPPEKGPFDVNVRSFEEETLYTIIRNMAIMAPEEFTQSKNYVKMAEVVKHALKCSHFMMPTFMKLTQIVRQEEMFDATTNVLRSELERKTTPIQQIALSSIIYYELNRYIPSIKSDTSVLGRMNYLSARVMEQEQLIRVIAACSVVLNESPGCCRFLYHEKCPVECTVSEVSPITETSTMRRYIKEVSKKKKKQDRAEFWSRFPEDWKTEVNAPAIMPTLEEGVPAIVAVLEARIGSLVWNIGQQNFVIHEKGGRLFPHAQVIQYMLPCYISILINADEKYQNSERNIAKKENIVKFLINIIALYEHCYQIWLDEKPVRASESDVDVDDIDNPELKVRCVMSGYLVERASFALHGFAGLGRMGEELDMMPQFSYIAQSIQEFPKFNSMGYASQIELLNSEAWLKNGYPHLRAIHQVCFTSMSIPNADSILHCHELQDIYFASALIHQLEIHYTLSDWCYKQFATGKSVEFRELDRISKPLRNWRYELFCIIFETEGKFDYRENMLSMFVNGKGKLLLSTAFNAYKKIRTCLDASTSKFQFVIPEWGTELKEKFDLFVDGELMTLSLFEKKPEAELSKIVQLPGTLATCNNCHRTETERGTFEQCQSCIDSNYPFPNFFCSDRCKEVWWKTEHMAEHLEFELGLCDFSYLNVAE